MRPTVPPMKIPGHKVTRDELLRVIQYYVPYIEMTLYFIANLVT